MFMYVIGNSISTYFKGLPLNIEDNRKLNYFWGPKLHYD